MSHIKGFVLMDVLSKAKRPLSLEEILDHIEKTVGKTVNEFIIEAVMNTLENGIKFGFLDCNNGKFFIVSDSVLNTSAASVNVSIDRMKRQSRQRQRQRRLFGSKSSGSDEAWTFRRNRSRSRVPPRSKPCTRCSSRRSTANKDGGRGA